VGEAALDRWTPLLWLVATLLATSVVTRWFSQQVASLAMLLTGNQSATLYIHFLIFLPGTLLHELSHWSVARLLGVRTGRLELGPKVGRDGLVQMGAVTYQRADAARESLVGLAPLVAGSIVVLLLTYKHFGLVLPAVLGLGDVWRLLGDTVHAPDAWIWLYLLLSVSNTMLPSTSDRRSWRTMGLYILLIVGVLYFAGVITEVPETVVAWLLQRALELAFAFGLTVLFDLIVGSILWAVTALLGVLLGRRAI